MKHHPPIDRLFFIRVLAAMVGAALGSGAVAAFLALMGSAW